MSDKLDMIYDLLKADREDNTVFKKEVRESHKQTDMRLTTLEIQGEVQNKSLKEHIDGVNTLKKLHQYNVDRIEKNKEDIVTLQEPAKVMSVLKKWTIGAGAVAAAIVAIAKFAGLF